jgi:hypothetical protein
MDILPQMQSNMVLSEAEALKFFAFLLASARSQLKDPASYASMRLLTVAEDLREVIRERVSPETLELLESTEALSEHAQVYMDDEEVYEADLDELCRLTTRFFVDKSGLQGEAT